MRPHVGSANRQQRCDRRAASSFPPWLIGSVAIGTSGLHCGDHDYRRNGEILEPRPELIIWIIFLASWYCLSTLLTSAGVVPLPVAMRLRRLPSMISGE